MTAARPVAYGALMDGDYRYELWREWATDARFHRRITFVMLNPSTADASTDDPTIRRCMGFARKWGYSGIVVVNLYAYRATKPGYMFAAADPVGPRNDHFLRAVEGVVVVAAWGANARPERVAQAVDLIGANRLYSLGVTKDGHPRHPLYVKADADLIPWPVPS